MAGIQEIAGPEIPHAARRAWSTAAIGPGSLDLPAACARAKKLATRPLKFTLTGPHMLAKMLLNTHYKDKAAVAMAIADVLAEQVKYIDAEVIQVDEANLPGSPEEWEWAAEAMNRVLDAIPTTPAVHLCFGNYGGQSIQKGGWGQLINYLNALHVDHIVMENAHRPPEELAVFKELQAGDRLRARRRRHQADGDRDPPTPSRAPSSTPTRCWGRAA